MSSTQRLAIDFQGVDDVTYPEITTIDNRKDKKKEERHWVIITNANEDTGQDDYYEELEWEIEHSPDCPKEIIKYSEWDDGKVYQHYTCGVGWVVENIGLDGLEIDWHDLEPGRYEIEYWCEKHTSYYSGYEEVDDGLVFVNP